MKRILLIIIVAPLFSGCMSAMSRAYRDDDKSIPRFYPGVCTDGYLVTLPFRHRDNESHSFAGRLGFACAGLVDLPLSIFFDTALLPIDIWAYHPRDQNWDDKTLEERRELRDAQLRKQEKSIQPSDATR